MNRDELIRLARDAGAPDWWIGLGADGVVTGSALLWLERFADLAAAAERQKCQDAVAKERASRRAAQCETVDLKERIARVGVEHRRAARKAVLDEREACAQVCEERAGTVSVFGTAKECAAHNSAVNECAAAIRARGNP